jgi:squalene cyclase
MPRKIARAMARGERFIRRRQHPDGGWFGSWGVCFTYGSWFGVEGLLAAGAAPADPAIWRACQFLLDHQNDDGGWGEHPDSCQEERYIELGESQAVNTAWALLTLCHAGHGGSAAAHRAAQFLVRRQQPDGDWPREALKGVFNRSTLINYEQYRRYFPLWALSVYRAQII